MKSFVLQVASTIIQYDNTRFLRENSRFFSDQQRRLWGNSEIVYCYFRRASRQI